MKLLPLVDMRKGGIHDQNTIAVKIYIKIHIKENYKNQLIFHNQRIFNLLELYVSY